MMYTYRPVDPMALINSGKVILDNIKYKIYIEQNILDNIKYKIYIEQNILDNIKYKIYIEENNPEFL